MADRRTGGGQNETTGRGNKKANYFSNKRGKVGDELDPPSRGVADGKPSAHPNQNVKGQGKSHYRRQDSSHKIDESNNINNQKRRAQPDNKAPRNANSANTNTAVVEPNSTVNQAVLNFWSRIRDSVELNTRRDNIGFAMTDDRDCELWLQCWSAAAFGAQGRSLLEALPRMYLHLPDTFKTTPSPDCVLPVLMKVLASEQQRLQSPPSEERQQNNKNSNKKSATNSIDKVIGTIDILGKVLRDRLLGELSLSRTLDPSKCLELLETFAQSFRKVLGELLAMDVDETKVGVLWSFLEYFKRYKAALEGYNASNLDLNADAVGFGMSTAEPQQWRDWITAPTVGWLMSSGSDSWLSNAPELTNSYESPEDYASTLLRLWTLLSFYWGAGAVWPKCHHSQGSGSGDHNEKNMCGNPLLIASNYGSCTLAAHGRDGRKVCGKPAAWRCQRHNHDAICIGCLTQHQNALAGPSGRHASTDIYDAVVTKEESRPEGSVFLLSSLKSRKPPNIEPNWLTSYRVQCSALVAVIKLSVNNEPLSRKHAIQWAEIVRVQPKDKDTKSEAHARKRGDMAVRILSRGDCSALRAEVDSPLELGTPVAIIDLRVFVPEVISVLATFAEPSFTTHLTQIPFIGRLIGAQASPPPVLLPQRVTIAQCIEHAVLSSELECIQMLPERLRVELCGEISRLSPIQTLYGTQLQAFVSALSTAVHCTQGPPGTGKVSDILLYCSCIC